jgi:hypothetical protein
MASLKKNSLYNMETNYSRQIGLNSMNVATLAVAVSGRGRSPVLPLAVLHRPAAVLPPTKVGVVHPVSQTHTTRTTPTS